MLETTNYLE